MDQPILVTKAEGYRIITLNRPDKLNAFTAEMNLQLQSAFADADKDPSCRALLFTGAGRAFSAGQDLGAVQGARTRTTRQTLDELWNPLARTIASYRMPVVAAINGVAAGAGLNLALGCDIVVAARSAKLMQPFSKIALVPDAGGTWHLPRLVGAQRARALMMLGDAVMAEEAVAMGMIYRAIDDAKLMDEAKVLTARVAAMPTRALFAIRRAAVAAETNSLDQQLDLERDLQSDLADEPDAKEGIKAFLEKRAAKFTGAKS